MDSMQRLIAPHEGGPVPGHTGDIEVSSLKFFADLSMIRSSRR
jgi:hypothetical protein